MKKKLFLILLLTVICVGCTTNKKMIDEKKRANMESYILLKDLNHNFQTSSFEELLRFLDDKETAAFYIGYPDCAWCKEAVPVLNEVAKEQNKKIYSIALYDAEGNRSFDKKAYEKFVDIAKDSLDKDEENHPTLYVPFVFTIKNGAINNSHIATVEGHNAKEREMTKEERKLLKDIYTNLLH